MMKILITNDDGIEAAGITVLEQWLQHHGHQTLVVAPEVNMSGQSGAITLGKPLVVIERGRNQWAVAGSPADCIRIALAYLNFHPDLVMSGINHGFNLGLDVYASGTVGAARMASIRGIPAVALSAPAVADWDHILSLLDRHGPTIMAEGLIQGPYAVLSVNFPPRGGDLLVSAKLSGPQFVDEVQWAELKNGNHVVTLASKGPSNASRYPKTDVEAIDQRHTVVTQLPLVSAPIASAYLANTQ